MDAALGENSIHLDDIRDAMDSGEVGKLLLHVNTGGVVTPTPLDAVGGKSGW